MAALLTGASNARVYEKIVIFDQYLALCQKWYKTGRSYYGRRIVNRIRTFEWYQFQWSWVTLSNLVKYSVIRSIAQYLRDSWASCSVTFRTMSYNTRNHWYTVRKKLQLVLSWRCETGFIDSCLPTDWRDRPPPPLLLLLLLLLLMMMKMMKKKLMMIQDCHTADEQRQSSTCSAQLVVVAAFFYKSL